MGCCCSCCCVKGASGASLEAEMTSTSSNNNKGTNLSISKTMSAPTIRWIAENKISGTGLALAGVTIEQDAAYWEWHLETSEDDDDESSSATDVMFGVATRKDSKFYQTTEDGEEDSSNTASTALMRTISVQHKDTVGVAVQQSDLPMIQFLVNGEPLHDLAINRFRGSVYPSIYLQEEQEVTATLVLNEADFKEMSPHARFGPLIVARGII